MRDLTLVTLLAVHACSHAFTSPWKAAALYASFSLPPPFLVNAASFPRFLHDMSHGVPTRVMRCSWQEFAKVSARVFVYRSCSGEMTFDNFHQQILLLLLLGEMAMCLAGIPRKSAFHRRKFSTNSSPFGRIQQVQNAISCHHFGAINLNSIEISAGHGTNKHLQYK